MHPPQPSQVTSITSVHVHIIFTNVHVSSASRPRPHLAAPPAAMTTMHIASRLTMLHHSLTAQHTASQHSTPHDSTAVTWRLLPGRDDHHAHSIQADYAAPQHHSITAQHTAPHHQSPGGSSHAAMTTMPTASRPRRPARPAICTARHDTAQHSVRAQATISITLQALRQL